MALHLYLTNDKVEQHNSRIFLILPHENTDIFSHDKVVVQ